MRLYNKEKSTIEDVKTIVFNGVIYTEAHLSKFSGQELDEKGYNRVVYKPTPNRRYYKYVKTGEIIDNVYVVDYTKTPRDVEELKQILLKDLKKYFEKIMERPRLQTSLGFPVDGGRSDKDNFKELWESMLNNSLTETTIKDADNEFQTVTTSQVETIYREIVAYGQSTFTTKWFKEEQEINLLNTIEDVIAYENAERVVLREKIKEDTNEVELDEDGNVVIEEVTITVNRITEGW